MSLFTTLDKHRNETITRRERFAILMASVGGAVLIVTGVTLVMVYM